ncbi:MAG: galactose mutarotase, partial [Cycloclasticus sp.]|nr:galactose mutarotase [Cycloclasticus sp.]
SCTLPDQQGQAQEITLGLDNITDYIHNNHPHFGSTIGRVAGRITHAQFICEGQSYSLAKNYNQQHHIHGGINGFDRVMWQVVSASNNTIKLHYLSPHGDEGYPGNVHIIASYDLTESNALVIEYTATTDKTTPINLTNHTYWNLAGMGQFIFDHQLCIPASHYVDTDEQHLLPNGKMLTVHDTPVNFLQPTRMGEHLQQVKKGYGHDQFYILDDDTHHLRLAAQVWEPTTRRKMEVYTTQPGIQFYTANNLAKKYSAFCLEAQNYPDAINHTHFPSCLLHPGEIYQQKTVYQFTRSR